MRMQITAQISSIVNQPPAMFSSSTAGQYPGHRGNSQPLHCPQWRPNTWPCPTRFVSSFLGYITLLRWAFGQFSQLSCLQTIKRRLHWRMDKEIIGERSILIFAITLSEIIFNMEPLISFTSPLNSRLQTFSRKRFQQTSTTPV